LSKTRIPPLLKWPGGKRKLLGKILPLLPQQFGKYYEPFLGGGALFFALQPGLASLSDNNADLICAYTQVRDNLHAVLEGLRGFHNSERAYYRVRSATPTSDAERAARLIYLSTLSFNGIHRVNLKGAFNVPYGYKTHLPTCDSESLCAASAALQDTTISCQDFESTISAARPGDLVYLDPPYTVAHGSNGFLKYNAKIFSWEDQERLATAAKGLASKGCSVIISNADHPSIRALYRDFHVEQVRRPSVIAAAAEFRRPITECIFYRRSDYHAQQHRTL
jgi:DNA adenine methylase